MRKSTEGETLNNTEGRSIDRAPCKQAQVARGGRRASSQKEEDKKKAVEPCARTEKTGVGQGQELPQKERRERLSTNLFGDKEKEAEGRRAAPEDQREPKKGWGFGGSKKGGRKVLRSGIEHIMGFSGFSSKKKKGPRVVIRLTARLNRASPSCFSYLL